MIVTRRLTYDYPGGVRALDHLSVAIPQGDFVFLVGPNGAGKTTLFKLLILEQRASEGRILFDGRDILELQGKRLARHRRLLGSVFQDTRLIAAKTVFENIALPLQAEGARREEIGERVAAVLFLTGLEELASRFPNHLSGGQRQQVAIARALANCPRAILADEPTANLSPEATRRIMHLLSVINSCGITVIVATHNHEVVDMMSRRVVALDQGRLAYDQDHSLYPEALRAAAASAHLSNPDGYVPPQPAEIVSAA